MRITLKRLVSRGEIPGSDGGIYNPGAFLSGDYIYLICRREVDNTVRRHVAHAEVLQLEAATLDLVDHYTLIRRGYSWDARLEDFRAIKIQEELLVVHSHVTESSISPKLSRVVGNYLEFIDPLVLPIPTNRVEKNWVLFEHEFALHCLYQLDPLTIFRRGAFGGWTLLMREANGWNDEFPGILSCSTNLIPFQDGYLGFWHTQIDDGYVHGAFVLDNKLSIKYKTGILLDSSHADTGNKPGVLYISSIIHQGNHILAFYGEGDAHSSVAIFDACELEVKLKQQPFTVAQGIRIALDARTPRELWDKMLIISRLSRQDLKKRIWVQVENPNIVKSVLKFRVKNLSLRTITEDSKIDVDLRF